MVPNYNAESQQQWGVRKANTVHYGRKLPSTCLCIASPVLKAANSLMVNCACYVNATCVIILGKSREKLEWWKTGLNTVKAKRVWLGRRKGVFEIAFIFNILLIFLITLTLETRNLSIHTKAIELSSWFPSVTYWRVLVPGAVLSTLRNMTIEQGKFSFLLKVIF